MKATILAVSVMFIAAGVMVSEADARPNRRAYKKASNHRARAPKRSRVVRKRQPTRHYRKPVRRTVRRPVRRTIRRPVRQHYRKPARRTIRRPVRQHYRKPVRRHTYRPVYRSHVNTVTLTNRHSFAIRVAVRAGHSALCSANPVQSRQFLAPGSSVSVSTTGSFVCYRQLPTRFTAGTGWYRSVISARFMRLWL